MPTTVIDGYKFRFYSTDGAEPPHMHVIRGEREAKVWLGYVEVESNHGYPEHELNRVLRLTREHRDRLLEIWDAYFDR